MKCKLLIAGVGGQGILTINQIIGESAVKEEKQILASEVHGMAQRGGSVVSFMKIGNYRSPLMGHGEADILLSLEPVEALRSLDKAGSNTDILVNSKPIKPWPVTSGKEEYPDVEKFLEEAKSKVNSIKKIPASELARKEGMERAANIVMLGALSKLDKFPIEETTMIQTIKETFPERFVDINIKVFELGYKFFDSP
ncbi:hypothetical protein AKJ37_04560 [candidate division MSBL1 archaeon SCGC-AAA259I09]|uniref:Pyruvate/ketoisovalerate oxidoreductase catalytic domain-containing protein n=1 Tax=candidate division MSBL1 archaeon SCGC-AAA259I09 TaxID=1698267 RepID=A0A133URF8_9EURY|nr:hypothetical protein AKJ37_04560 [candidate division MSBL1 archaeon SCGC-AAA259I09]